MGLAAKPRFAHLSSRIPLAGTAFYYLETGSTRGRLTGPLETRYFWAIPGQ